MVQLNLHARKIQLFFLGPSSKSLGYPLLNKSNTVCPYYKRIAVCAGGGVRGRTRGGGVDGGGWRLFLSVYGGWRRCNVCPSHQSLGMFPQIVPAVKLNSSIHTHPPPTRYNMYVSPHLPPTQYNMYVSTHLPPTRYDYVYPQTYCTTYMV